MHTALSRTKVRQWEDVHSLLECQYSIFAGGVLIGSPHLFFWPHQTVNINLSSTLTLGVMQGVVSSAHSICHKKKSKCQREHYRNGD